MSNGILLLHVINLVGALISAWFTVLQRNLVRAVIGQAVMGSFVALEFLLLMLRRCNCRSCSGCCCCTNYLLRGSAKNQGGGRMKFRDFLAFVIVGFLFFGIFLSLHGNDSLFNTPLSEYSTLQDTPDPLIPIRILVRP